MTNSSSKLPVVSKRKLLLEKNSHNDPTDVLDVCEAILRSLTFYVTCWNSYGGGFEAGVSAAFDATAIVAQSVARVRVS